MVDIEQLSKLTRIKLDSNEKKKLQKEFEAILSYISKLKEADLISPEQDKEAEQTMKNVTRKDVDAHEKGKFSKELLEEAPAIERGYVKVKHVFD